MHLRRALLLFAIVLGLAALASSLSRQADRQADEADVTPPVTETAEPAPAPGAAVEDALRLPGPGGKRRAVLDAGQARTLLVSVTAPGEVDIPDLGLSAPGTPLTPARFELLRDEPGSFAVTFTPAGTNESRTLGRLEVR